MSIPERELAEAKHADALKVSEDRYRLLIDTIPHMVWMATAGGVTDFLNQRGAERLGVPLEAAYGWNWLELLHPADVDRTRRQWDAAVRTEASYVSEYRMRHADGTYRWYLAQAVPLRRPDGAVEAWVGTWTDIDARKQADEALRASEERFRQIAESISEVFWLASADKHEMVYVSSAYETIWGRSREGLYASPSQWLEAIHTDDRERVATAELTKQAVSGYDEEYRIVRPDGSVRWIRDRAFPVRDSGERVVRFAGVAEDITERRQLEAQLRQSQKMEAVGQLAGGLAHDFNNLLTIITGYSELLLDTLPPGDPSREFVDEIMTAADRSAALTRQLLAFSRKQVLAPAILDINEVVRDTEKMLRRVIGEDVELRAALQPHLGYVKADPGQLEQALLNLVVNARDAMPQGGTLTIETKNLALDDTPAATEAGARHACVMLSVSDSGSGMTDEVQRHVFEPFFTTKPPGKGTGLGLAVVHGFVQQSGGHVEISSALGMGTSVRIYLPRTDLPGGTGAAPADSAGALPRGTETILLVEDEEGVRTLARIVLQRCGYVVLEASRGDEALRIAAAQQTPIDLLVTDVVMPGGGGRPLAEQLCLSYPELKVLYVSGYTDDAVVRHGILHEQVNFLQKPFNPMALARKIRSVLSSTKASPGAS